MTDDNPEWTADDFARAKPGAEVLPAALVSALKRAPGRPAGSVTSNKQQVTLRLDRDVLERFRATGAGWQSRVNDALRDAASRI
ncbi:BrnA antitoxin family protein [Sphingomonas panni]